jgi:excisionase family DNA binding protein
VALSLEVPPLLVESIAQRTAEILTAQAPVPASPWLDANGAAEYLSSTPEAIRALVKRGQIPHHRSSETRRLYFARTELDEWVRGEAA